MQQQLDFYNSICSNKFVFNIDYSISWIISLARDLGVPVTEPGGIKDLKISLLLIFLLILLIPYSLIYKVSIYSSGIVDLSLHWLLFVFWSFRL